MSIFEKNQILIHNTWGDCVAIRPWNDHETICLVARSGQRHVLMNIFLKPMSCQDADGNTHIFMIGEDKMEELEARLLSGNQEERKR